MNLKEIKASAIPKRRLFQIERAIVREMTDLWFKQGCYFEGNFSDNVDVTFQGQQINVKFKLTRGLKQGSSEATVNELIKSLILTMATDPHTGQLLENYEYVIGNILDVFIYRLKELGDRKFLLDRLMTLDLGFRVHFGLGDAFAPISNARRFLDEMLISATSSTPEETVGRLLEAVRETEKLGLKEPGVTFHISMENDDRASFICLPFGIQQTTLVPLISEHTLRCNFIGTTAGEGNYQPRMFKVDAPSRPLQFVHRKGFHFTFDEPLLMEKLSSAVGRRSDFTENELSFLKLLFNEYVTLAHFLLHSHMIDPGVRLLMIFPRLNFFKILHEELPELPAVEPQTLGELASYYGLRFHLKDQPDHQGHQESQRIPERVLQERKRQALQALSQSTIAHIHSPLKKIDRDLCRFKASRLLNDSILERIQKRLRGISWYLKELHAIKRIVIDEQTQELDLAACIKEQRPEERMAALDEISSNIQLAEIEPLKDVITNKMLDYLSFATIKLEQLQKVAAPAIKEEIVDELNAHTRMILNQSKAFYKLLVNSGWEVRPR